MQKDKLYYENELKMIIGLFKLDDNAIVLKGSSSEADQLYYSDFDLFSPILKSYNIYQLNHAIQLILKKICTNEFVYFIELKIELKNGTKIKFFPNDEFDLNYPVSEINFIKIDCVIDVPVKYSFIEASVIYQLDQDNIFDEIKYEASLTEDINNLKKEKQYYKVLKRYYKIAKLKNYDKITTKLSEIFNSDVGKLYKEKSSLEAMKLVLKYYKDKGIKKRCNFYLKLMNVQFSISKLNKIIQVLNDVINKKGKLLLGLTKV